MPSKVMSVTCRCRKTVNVMCSIPASLSCTGKRRKKLCGIDKCMAPLVRALQRAKIGTTGCCCGHGKRGSVLLEDGTKLIVVWPKDTLNIGTMLQEMG